MEKICQKKIEIYFKIFSPCTKFLSLSQSSKEQEEDLEDYNERPMIMCEECLAWYHPICDDYFDAEVEHFENWFCSRCREKNPNLKVTYREVKYPAFQNPFELADYLEPYRENGFRDEDDELIIEATGF